MVISSSAIKLIIGLHRSWRSLTRLWHFSAASLSLGSMWLQKNLFYSYIYYVDGSCMMYQNMYHFMMRIAQVAMIQDGQNHWHQQLRGILQTWSIELIPAIPYRLKSYPSRAPCWSYWWAYLRWDVVFHVPGQN